MGQHFKTILMSALIFALLMVIIFGSGFLLQAVRAQGAPRATTIENTPNRTITVPGTSQVRLQPDLGMILIKVPAEAGKAEEAIKQSNEKLSALVRLLTGMGVRSEDIQTGTAQVLPHYAEQESGQQPIITVTAINWVEVQVHDLEKTGSLVDAIIQSGDYIIDNIRYEFSENNAEYEAARTEAMREARDKAEQLASLEGAELGEVFRIQEANHPSYLGNQNDSTGGEADEAAQSGIQLTEIEVQITWLLE